MPHVLRLGHMEIPETGSLFGDTSQPVFLGVTTSSFRPPKAREQGPLTAHFPVCYSFSSLVARFLLCMRLVCAGEFSVFHEFLVGAACNNRQLNKRKASTYNPMCTACTHGT